ncbi:MAG: ATP-binding cassette domain-containing protein [Sediminibacterium sp.]|nr:ATP-binding cassette domain-containing protein [Sediminibacterium sp.]
MEIELQNLTFQYDYPPSLVLQNINLKIEKGDVVALMGPSGSGKSTLIKIISSFLKPSSGNVLINGNPIQINKPYPNLAYVSQSSHKTLFPWLSVEKNIYYPNKLRGNLNSESKQYCDELLSTLKIDRKRKSFPFNLSGGEQKRLSLAVALSYKPEIILLDEPFSGIDFRLTEELWDVLYSDFQERKPTVLFVTHSLDEASLLASKTVFLKNISTEKDKEFFTLHFPDKTVFNFDGEPTLPRYEQMMNHKIIEYRKYLLEEFNKEIV